MDSKLVDMLVESNINDQFVTSIREIELFSVAEMEAKYEKKLVMGMHCEVLAYIIDDHRYKAWYVDEICNLGKVKCIIEESPKGIKISTLDLKYQIGFELIKSMKQIRFDHFDWYEGYVDFVGVNELDSNDVAAFEIEEFHRTEKCS